MTFMPWRDDLSVGLESIDEQHRWLLEATNRLHDEMSQEVRHREVIIEVIEGLIDYTVNHFIMEEELFYRHSYPDADAHKALHDQFTKTLLDILSHYEEGKEIGAEVLELLKNWLVQHIMVVDKAYVPFLAEKGVA
jgi:hemerythrin